MDERNPNPFSPVVSVKREGDVLTVTVRGDLKPIQVDLNDPFQGLDQLVQAHELGCR